MNLFLIIIPIAVVIIYIIYYKNITPHKKNNIREIYAEGLDMLVAGKRTVAYQNFKNIIDQDSNNIKAYLKLGQVLREGGNPLKALKIHKNLLLRKNLSSYELIELHKNLSLNYLKIENLSKSIEEAKMILGIDQNNEWAILHLIQLYKNDNNWKDATEYLKLYFDKTDKKDNHKLALYKVQHAKNEIECGHFQDARDILDRVLNIEADLAIAYYFIGQSYSEESSYVYDKALELEKKGLNSMTDQDNYNTYISDAKAILSKAIPMWIHYLEINYKQSWLVLPLLKDALFTLDRYSELEEILSAINDKNSDSIEILASLADYYSHKGEIKQAIEIIEHALNKNNKSILVKLIRFKLNLQNSNSPIGYGDLDEIISLILKDTSYQMINDTTTNSDIKWIFKNKVILSE